MKIFKKEYNDSYFDTLSERITFLRGIKMKANLIRAHKKQGKLLEIGCGDGLLLNELKNEFDIFGTDISQFALKKAQRLVDERKLKILDVEKEDLPDQYDVIIAFDVLEHLRDPKKAMIRVGKALNKDGVFIFSVPNNYGFFGKLSTKILNYFDKTHISTYERKKWVDMIKEMNFKKMEIINKTWFGFQKADFSKHFASSFVVVLGK